MGLLSLLKRPKGLSNDALSQIEQVADLCTKECDSCACEDSNENSSDEAKFAKLKIEMEDPLFGSSKTSKIHFIVPTSQTDWAHDACSEKRGSVQNRVATWIDANKSQYKGGVGEVMRCSVSSMPIDIMDIDVMRGKKNNVLVLPHFLWIKNLKADDVGGTLEELVPLLVANKREELMKKDNIEEAKEQSFIFLCSHNTRDKRCGITAPILKKHFEEELREKGLFRDISDFRPDGCSVFYVNHVGGHKYAANVIIYLKKSHSLIWLARVTPKHTKSIIDLIVIPEKPKLPWPEKVRCVQKYESW